MLQLNSKLSKITMKSLVVLLAFTFLQSGIYAQKENFKAIFFDNNKFDLSKQETLKLDSIYVLIASSPNYQLQIIGHANISGNEANNLILSKKRAEAVSEYLLKKGINKNFIEVQFLGDSQSSHLPKNENNLKQNRRVDIIWTFNEMDDTIFKRKKPQTFIISASKDTAITCQEGTIIKISKNSFTSEQSGKSATGLIALKVEEYYKVSDMILANLSTVSNGDLLETGGMINIEAFSQKNEKLQLQYGKTIEISFPTNNFVENMQLFTGTFENKKMNWETMSLIDGDTAQVFTSAEIMPIFPGGEANLRQYLSQNTIYPKQAKINGIQGVVVVSFVINQKGEVTNPLIIKSISPELDSAALSVVSKMPNWEPGFQQDKSISVMLNIPINFTLGDNFLKGEGTFTDRFEQTYSDSTVSKTRSNNVSSYIFQSTNLGWLNCDRFINSFPLKDLNIKLDKNTEQVFVVFHRYKSIVIGYSENGYYRFSKIPSNEKITIFVIKRINDLLFIAEKETKPASYLENDFEFKQVTMNELKTIIEKLNKL